MKVIATDPLRAAPDESVEGPSLTASEFHNDVVAAAWRQGWNLDYQQAELLDRCQELLGSGTVGQARITDPAAAAWFSDLAEAAQTRSNDNIAPPGRRFVIGGLYLVESEEET